MLRVVPHAPDKSGAATRQPRKPKKIDARLFRYTTLMLRLAFVVEGIDLQPVEIDGIAGRPDNRRHACLDQIEFENGMDDTVRVCGNDARLGFFREIETVAGRIGIRSV